MKEEKFLKIYDTANDITHIPPKVIFYSYPIKKIIGWFFHDGQTIWGDHCVVKLFNEKIEREVLLKFKEDIFEAQKSKKIIFE